MNPENVSSSSEATRARWGVTTSSSLQSTPAPIPFPIEREPQPAFAQRVKRSVSSPITAGVVLFFVIVLVVGAATWFTGQRQWLDTGEANQDSEATQTIVDPEVSTTQRAADDTHSQSSSATPVTMLVHVVGEVVQPGLVELESGDRVADAIHAAGGATEAAVLSGINLARAVNDGEQVVVPNEAQVVAGAVPQVSNGVSPPGNHASLINLNTADAATLERLPKVGPQLAQRIIDWRSANGGFTRVEQMLDVSGIGEKTFAELQSLVTL